MSRGLSIVTMLAGLVLCASTSAVRAQGWGSVPPIPPACTCGGQAPHYHVNPDGTVRSGGNIGRGATAGSAGPIYGLPRGRRYYGGRFFGSFNNRFYGPQYGNF